MLSFSLSLFLARVDTEKKIVDFAGLLDVSYYIDDWWGPVCLWKPDGNKIEQAYDFEHPSN